MIGGYIGKAIGEPVRRTALQSVVAGVDASVAFTKSVGKIILAQIDAAVIIVKDVAVTVTAAAIDLSASVTNSVGKSVATAIDITVGSTTLIVGKIVSTGVNLTASVSKVVSLSVTATVSLAATIVNYIRRGGPLLRNSSSGKPRSYWRGRS